jgi:hypothetical protein
MITTIYRPRRYPCREGRPPEGTFCLPSAARPDFASWTRIGLEDTLVGPAGEPISGNADLVRLALTVWTAAVS